MLSDRVLANFKEYLATHPRGPVSNPAGAYDARPSRPRMPRIRDFSAGGAYDSVGGMVDSVMQFCKAKGMGAADLDQLSALLDQPTGDGEGLSAEEEKQFQDLAKRRKATGAQDDPAPFPGRPQPGGGMDPIRATTTGMDSVRRPSAADLAAFKKRIGDDRTIRVLG